MSQRVNFTANPSLTGKELQKVEKYTEENGISSDSELLYSLMKEVIF